MPHSTQKRYLAKHGSDCLVRTLWTSLRKCGRDCRDTLVGKKVVQQLLRGTAMQRNQAVLQDSPSIRTNTIKEASREGAGGAGSCQCKTCWQCPSFPIAHTGVRNSGSGHEDDVNMSLCLTTVHVHGDRQELVLNYI